MIPRNIFPYINAKMPSIVCIYPSEVLTNDIYSCRRERKQQEGLPDDPTEGGGRSSVRLLPERVVRRRGRSGRQLQPDRLAVRRAHR